MCKARSNKSLDASGGERLSQLAWCGEGCFNSRRRVNSDVMRQMFGAQSHMTPEEPNTNRDLRWPRLFAVFLWNFGFFFLASLFGELSWDVWKYGFARLTVYVVLAWLGRSLGFGLFCG